MHHYPSLIAVIEASVIITDQLRLTQRWYWFSGLSLRIEVTITVRLVFITDKLTEGT